MANQKTHIVQRGEEVFVLPPVADLSPGDQWKIVNHTTEDWSVTLSAALCDDGGPGPVGVKRPVAAAAHLPLKIHMHAPKGAYEYQVVSKSGRKARGNSDPMVIIDM